MKKLLYLFLASVAVTFMPACKSNQQEKITDIPVTTQNADAKASYLEGVQLVDQGDMQQGKVVLTKAVEQDPKISIAYLMMPANSTKEFSEHLASAKANMEGAS